MTAVACRLKSRRARADVKSRMSDGGEEAGGVDQYRGRADVLDGQGRKLDDVFVTVRGRAQQSAARGTMTAETVVGWRRFRLSRQREYVMRLADGRQVEIVVERISPRTGGDIAILCPRGIPPLDDERRRWRHWSS